MAKKEFTKLIADETGLSQQQVGRVIQRVLDSIVETLAADGMVELRKFGVFKLKTRASRTVRNPKTGVKSVAPEKTIIVFKPGNSMIAKVNEFEKWRLAEPIVSRNNRSASHQNQQNLLPASESIESSTPGSISEKSSH